MGEAKGGIWASGQSGLLWFFDRGNAEVLVKVLDGCSYNDRRWVFVAPVTDVAFNLHVTDSRGPAVDASESPRRDRANAVRHERLSLRIAAGNLLRLDRGARAARPPVRRK